MGTAIDGPPTPIKQVTVSIGKYTRRTGPANMRTSILDRFVEHSTHFQDTLAIFINDRSYSYGELSNFCSALCALLNAHGIRKGDRVGVLTENTIYTYASLLGLWACGACYVPLNPENPDRKSTRLNSSHVRISYAVFCLKKKIPSLGVFPTVSHQIVVVRL